MKGENLGYVPFDRFAQAVGLDRCPRYDDKHVIVQVDDLSEVLA